MEVIAPCRREGESVRFFVSAPGQHLSFSALGFINQGNTTLLECRMEACHIFSVSGLPVDVIYNSSVSGWNSRNISVEAPMVRLLRRSWDDFFSGCGSTTALRLQVCAGDGAFVVRAALRGYLHAHRVFILAFAPSCAIDPESCFRVRHYRAQGDVTSLCSGPGSAYPEFSVIPRHWESRGLIDLAVYSSTFQEFLRLEALGFDFQESSGHVHGHYDELMESIRLRYGSSFEPCLRTGRERAIYLLRSLANLGRPIGDNYLINFVEEALDEFPRDLFETFTQRAPWLRDLWLIAAQVAIGILVGGSENIRIAAIGIPVLRAGSLFARMGVYVIYRNEERPCCWRRLALRSRVLNILCLLYESAISCSLLVSGEAPGFLVHGFLGYVIVRNLEGIFENTVILCSPLRGRIQGRLTVVSEEDISTERNENEEADRVGYIARILSSTGDIFAGASGFILGVTTAVAAASFLTLSSTGDPSSTESNVTNTSSSTSSVPVLLGIISGFTVSLAVTSVICNSLQIRRMFRRLRGSQGAERIPLVPTAPPMEDDENIEEIPLSELSPESDHED